MRTTSLCGWPLLLRRWARRAPRAIGGRNPCPGGRERVLLRASATRGRMEITIGGETRYKTMNALAQGSTKAFVEFTNPEDRGVRYLKRDKNLWIYFPREQDTVKISGHLLKEGMMGSDVSYEDALESSDYAEKYTAALKQDETVGTACFVVELTAKVDTAAYDRRVLWIDAERYVTLKQEMYAKSGRLLKVSNTLKVDRVGRALVSHQRRVRLQASQQHQDRVHDEQDRAERARDGAQFSMAALTR